MQRVYEVFLIVIVTIWIVALSPFLVPVIIWFAVSDHLDTRRAFKKKVNETWTQTDLANSRT